VIYLDINLRKLLLIIISILGVFILADFISNMVIEYQYDVIFVGSDCSCDDNVNGCSHVYGLKGDTKTELNISYKKDKSNINRILVEGVTNTVVYFDYDTYNEILKKNNGKEITDKLILDNHYKYNYKKKDLEMFNKIIESINEGDEELKIDNFKYYIPTANNYYFFNNSNNSLYKYDETLNSLELYAAIDSCDIEYFLGK